MRIILGLSVLLFFTTVISAQVALDLQASSEGESQLRLRSISGGELFNLRVNNDGVLRFIANNNDEVMQIDDDNEHVAIGTSAHDFINLYSFISLPSDESRYGVYTESNGSGTGARYGLYGRAGGTSGNRYGVYGSASFGNGRWGVYCQGNLWYTGSITSVSDQKFKSDIRNIDQGLTQILKLKPRSYTFKQDVKGLELSKTPQVGFVAQELEKVLPDLVETNMHDINEGPDDTNEKIEIKGVNYMGLIPILTKAIQEQQEIIRSLEQRILVLEKG